MARVKGNTTPLLTLKVGVGSAVDFGADVVSVEFTDGEGQQVTMSDFQSGVIPVQMNVTYVLDFADTKAFEFHWANAGEQEVEYAFRRDGDAALGQTNPEFNGTLTMPPKPRFTIEGSNDDQTWDASYALDTYEKDIS